MSDFKSEHLYYLFIKPLHNANKVTGIGLVCFTQSTLLGTTSFKVLPNRDSQILRTIIISLWNIATVYLVNGMLAALGQLDEYLDFVITSQPPTWQYAKQNVGMPRFWRLRQHSYTDYKTNSSYNFGHAATIPLHNHWCYWPYNEYAYV